MLITLGFCASMEQTELTPEEHAALEKDLQAVLKKHNAGMATRSVIELFKINEHAEPPKKEFQAN
ncbi:MAG: hypothetical protein HN402_07945 [Candidatus Scalindua sp.]|jgi:hypothetical protein|nr:hypothetical protein [Candidatus Scalindua sp.]